GGPFRRLEDPAGRTSAFFRLRKGRSGAAGTFFRPLEGPSAAGGPPSRRPSRPILRAVLLLRRPTDSFPPASQLPRRRERRAGAEAGGRRGAAGRLLLGSEHGLMPADAPYAKLLPWVGRSLRRNNISPTCCAARLASPSSSYATNGPSLP